MPNRSRSRSRSRRRGKKHRKLRLSNTRRIRYRSRSLSIRRKSPAESATHFKLGTKKEGLDGNIWTVVKSGNSRRWSLKGIQKKDKKERKSGLYYNSKGWQWITY